MSDETADRFIDELRNYWHDGLNESLQAAMANKDFDEAARILQEMAAQRRRRRKAGLG